MPSITLTVLITAIVVIKSPITIDSSAPPPTQDQHRHRHRDGRGDSPLNTPTASRPPKLTPHHASGPSSPSPNPSLSKTRSTHPGPKSNTPRATRNVNLGRKIGLLFVGMAGLLQVAVVGFLGFRRWRISNIKEDSADSPA